VFAAVVVVPELRGDEDVLALDEAVLDGTLDALAGLFFILVVCWGQVVLEVVFSPEIGSDGSAIVDVMASVAKWTYHKRRRKVGNQP
jgi:hypothetical protein